jgi:cyclopropane-fatty-acyl-phospholipid synthase
MNPFPLEHGRVAYFADFVLYALAVACMAAVLFQGGPGISRAELAAYALAGFAGWTLVEYAMHRFVLHGLDPFRRWHALHHERPTARIGTPTVLSMLVFVVFAFLPASLLAGPWRGGAITLGLVAGYFAYALVHHGTHHWSARIAWFNRRKRWHALHHHGKHPSCFGVTTGIWDRVFGTAGRSGT